jgi:hypothetical protein
MSIVESSVERQLHLCKTADKSHYRAQQESADLIRQTINEDACAREV